MKNLTINKERLESINRLNKERKLQYSIQKVRSNRYQKYVNRDLYLVTLWGDNRLKAIEDFKSDTGYEQSTHRFYTLTLTEAIEWVEAIFKILNYKKPFKKNTILFRKRRFENDRYKITTHQQTEVEVNGVKCYTIKKITEELFKNKLKGTGFKLNKGDKKVIVSHKKRVIKVEIKTKYSYEYFLINENMSFKELDEKKLEFLSLAVESIAAELYNSTVNSVEYTTTRLEF